MRNQREPVDNTSTRNALALGGVAGALASFNEARTVYNNVRELWASFQSRGAYTLELSQDDLLFNDALDWLDSLITDSERRALVARSGAGSRLRNKPTLESSDTGLDEPRQQLIVTSVSRRSAEVDVDGHNVTVALQAPEVAAKVDAYAAAYAPEKLVFTCTSKAGQAAVVANLERLLAEREQANRQPVVRILDPRWGSWNHRGDLPPRPLDTVTLRAGQLERLVKDLEDFLASEKEYNSRALPWHRGYLLEGPPGTGKTSVARALASHFGMDLWYAPLGDVKDDSQLLSLLAQVHARSMVLLEDIDVFAATREREAEKAGDAKVTLSGLLNALDGVATPHGLVTFLTTNRPMGLDEALTRPGRCDVVEVLELPDVEQATRMFHRFYGDASTVIGNMKVEPRGASTAYLMEVLKQHLYDPHGAFEQLDARAEVG